MSFPAPIYRDTVLATIFADAQRLFLDSMIEIDYAHLLMLHQQKIVSRETTVACLRALDALDLEALRTTPYDGKVEDLFFLVEEKLADACGPDNAGRIHTARSRNDLDMTMYRMVLRTRLLKTVEAVTNLRACLLTLAEEHRNSLMPAYTHNQPAQPTTLGHYLMAIVEVLERDTERLQSAYTRVNRSPLGAAAITTTGFPIDRACTMKALAFEGLQTNSYGAIAAVDYLTESCSVLAVCMLNLGRFTQDMLLWSTAEFNYLRLSDGYVQISSIMPQKRNPVPLEHVRILSSRALTESQACLNSLHNTPFADMNDSEDSFQPLVDLAFTDGLRALTLLEGALSEATFNTAHMAQRAADNFLTVTELADTLVRQTGISFHQAHGFVAAAVKAANGIFHPDAMVASIEQALAAANIKTPTTETLRRALDPAYFVAIRTIPGGPAPAALTPELERAATQLTTDRTWTSTHREAIAQAHQQLHQAAADLTC